MERDIQDVLHEMNDEQQLAVLALLDTVLEDDLEHSDFDANAEIQNIFSDAKKCGSLKDAFLEHAENYGIEEIEELFPKPNQLNKRPTFINNKVEHVAKILGAVHQMPTPKVKVMFADITAESLRAKGYEKGDLKVEDVFSLMARETEPCTIYKKAKIDRDDVMDITDFDVVAMIKDEMRMKLEEEIARAILIGDGRDPEDEHKIDEECIRPIVSDHDFYSVKVAVDANAENPTKAFMEACVRGRKEYKGSGRPTLFTTEDLVADMLLLEDKNGRKIHMSENDIKSALRVSDIVCVPDMVDLKRDNKDVLGIIVNLADYSVGAVKGGKMAMFDDFDIDYNQHKFLIETRMSGSLLKPASALVIEKANS